MVLLQCGKMRSPGLSRAIWSQCNLEHGGAVRINREQNGRIEGENLVVSLDSVYT
jgi:hypothetical protein